ncbi:MAG: cation diffusion facilitator family transporter, partial [Calditrichaeota bacterium]|nr:cation diffusion facilitator family transporter [Calditrichota bacterium]
MGVRLPPLAPQPSGTGQDSEITRPSGDTRTTDSDLIREAREISAATRIGLYWNLILGALKFAAGLLVGSLALLADGFNSVADVLTDLALIVGARMAARPPDRSHPFGHGKIETFVAGGVDIGVIVVGAGIVWSAVEALMGGSKSPIDGVPVVFVSAGTIVVKEWLFRRTRLVAARCRSAAL